MSAKADISVDVVAEKKRIFYDSPSLCGSLSWAPRIVDCYICNYLHSISLSASRLVISNLSLLENCTTYTAVQHTHCMASKRWKWKRKLSAINTMRVEPSQNIVAVLATSIFIVSSSLDCNKLTSNGHENEKRLLIFPHKIKKKTRSATRKKNQICKLLSNISSAEFCNKIF